MKGLLRRRVSSAWILASAYALPPKVVTDFFRSESVFATLTRRDPRQTEILSDKPVLHGGAALARDGRRFLVLTADATHVQEFVLVGGDSKNPRILSASKNLRDALFTRPLTSGAFRLFPDRLAFRPEPQQDVDFWSVPLGFEAVGLGARDSSGWILGWGPSPARLFAFPPNRLLFHRIEWRDDSEPVLFQPCDRSRSLLVENVSDGRNRVVFFEGFTPRAYSSFDLSRGKGLSDITAAALRSCEDLVLAGSFGVVRVRFDKR